MNRFPFSFAAHCRKGEPIVERPFIQLFRTPNSGYFLDVNRNEFIPVAEAAFQHLREVMSGKRGFDDSAPQELRDLKAQGYLSFESAVKEVRHPYSGFLGTFLDRKLAKITLQLTQNCNFRCKYCIYSEDHNLRQRSHSNKRMSWVVAKKAVDFLWAHSVDSKEVNVGFYGGEPLLEFPLIQQAVEYCRDRFSGKKVTFTITTNGSLLSDEMIRYFQANDVSMMISLDGPKEINDRNRVFPDGLGTYDTVVEHIAKVREIAPEYAEKLQVSMVMDPASDFDCINSICLDASVIDKQKVMASLVDRDYDDVEAEFSEEYASKFEYNRFLAIMANFRRFQEGEVSPLVSRAVFRELRDHSKIEAFAGLTLVDAPSGPCIPGQMRLFADVNGRLFPCERVSETSPAMCIGTLDDGFDLENANRLLNVGDLTESACKQCWSFRYCGMCAKKADVAAAALSAEAKLLHCQQHKSAAYGKLKQYLLFWEVPSFYAAQTRRLGEQGGETV